MTTAALIPGPPIDQEEWSGDEEEAFVVFVWGRYAREEGTPKEGPQPLVMDFGAGTTLVMFTDRDLAERFAASPTLVEIKGRAMVKGTRAEQFIALLGICVESGWIKKVLVDPAPFHEWVEGNAEGCVADAAELHADLKEAYRDFLVD